MDNQPKIIFFDNEIRNWGEDEFKDMKEHDSNIKFYLVDDTIPNDISRTFTPPLAADELQTNKGYIQAYINHFADLGNTYALYLKEQLTKGDIQTKKILKQEGFGRGFPTNGFDEYISMLEQLPENSKDMDDPANTYILSDWDRTVTAVEGIYFGQNFELLDEIQSGNVLLDDVINYIMGGPERAEKIKKLLSELLKKNILFIILTHNPAASKSLPSREIYLEILSKLFGIPKNYIDEYLLFSSYDFVPKGNKPYKNKSACHSLVSRFLNYCDTIKEATIGGKKHKRKYRKTKRNKKNKRTSRRSKK